MLLLRVEAGKPTISVYFLLFDVCWIGKLPFWSKISLFLGFLGLFVQIKFSKI